MSKHIAMISGGKDSTAMAIILVENNMHIDEWIFCDTGKEFPQMYDHLDKLEKYLNIKLTRIIPKKSFDFYMSEHIKVKGKNKGCKGYGWPVPHRWCTTLLKQNQTKKYLRKYDSIIEYHGIALDEKERTLKNKNKIVKYPLIDFNMTEQDCINLCYERGFNWDGLYEDFKRVSCFCCPLSRVEELRTLHRKYPQLWEEMRVMNKNKDWIFKQNKTFDWWDERFKKEMGGE